MFPRNVHAPVRNVSLCSFMSIIAQFNFQIMKINCLGTMSISVLVLMQNRAWRVKITADEEQCWTKPIGTVTATSRYSQGYAVFIFTRRCGSRDSEGAVLTDFILFMHEDKLAGDFPEGGALHVMTLFFGTYNSSVTRVPTPDKLCFQTVFGSFCLFTSVSSLFLDPELLSL